ncbi:o-succinylbenzoate synthase [Ammoniphilus sp. YIM 78166]|uniref:o-succinylbenzoate synthase n=1 Tax=Ammoniphilus sp. YIM 78166 TaxID=1644106 RepID=UPI00106FAB3C|nr:o-succinylbenzoate synthase [Ammoniphilus sp. YIM 78166]
MNIEKFVFRKMKLQLKAPFQTSFGTQTDREFILVEAHSGGQIGYGECVAMTEPIYNEETVKTCWHVMEDFLIPMLYRQETLEHPDQVSEVFAPIRRNNMAKAAIEGAVWDLYAKQQNQPLAKALGGTKSEIGVGVSIGIQESPEDLLKVVEGFIAEGYQRMKIKIKPGKDVEMIRAVRERFPDVPMMADANSAYTLNDVAVFKELDQFNLMMIEQPLAHDDIIDHAKLQAQIQTPICLDESIHSLEDARKAVELGSCKIINIKVGRVGGLTESNKIHDYCLSQNIPLWCGGMLESGVGRAHNIAITSLANFVMPGDTSGSSRYWHEDIIEPEVVVSAKGTIEIPATSGIGYQPVPSLLEKYTLEKKEIRR